MIFINFGTCILWFLFMCEYGIIQVSVLFVVKKIFTIRFFIVYFVLTGHTACIIHLGDTFMYRYAIEKLYKLEESKRRKPLIIEGARWVGKTNINPNYLLSSGTYAKFIFADYKTLKIKLTKKHPHGIIYPLWVFFVWRLNLIQNNKKILLITRYSFIIQIKLRVLFNKTFIDGF